jgi:Right handed beta helix region
MRRFSRAAFVLLVVVTGCTAGCTAGSPPSTSGSAPAGSASAGGTPVAVPAKPSQLCGSAALNSPFSYHGPAGRYASGKAGLPTYGTAGSDFPHATAGLVLAPGTRSYLSYQLSPDTVYYLLPGVHTGTFQADRGDAFVGGLSAGTASVLSGNYTDTEAVDSNFSDGNQPGVTIEYLTIEKFLAQGEGAAINQDSNTGWTLRYDTVTLNAPGAGMIAGADNTLEHNCLTLNGQYGFQSSDVNSWGQDAVTGGPYNVTIEDNEISYNDTCDFEGTLANAAIGWSKYNPVPARYRNPHCGQVNPDGNEGGFKLWKTDGVTIKDNYIHNNWGPGIWADTDNANTTYVGNTITGNDDEAIIEEISYNFSITGNYLADNDWVGGLGNPEFPSPAIYVSQSGSDRKFGGVPRCPEASCSGQPSYSGESVISRNTLVNNGGNVFLWQNSDRFCSAGYDNFCTLVDGASSGPFTIPACKSGLPSASIDTTTYASRRTGSPAADWWDGCMWWSSNVTVSQNTIYFDPAQIADCNKTDWPDCGAGGLFAEYGISAPYDQPRGWPVLSQVTFFSGDTWSDNIYDGPSTFYAWNQGNSVSWSQWTGPVSEGDKCSSSDERASGTCAGPFGQDTGSTYQVTPVASAPGPTLPPVSGP